MESCPSEIADSIQEVMNKKKTENLIKTKKTQQTKNTYINGKTINIQNKVEFKHILGTNKRLSLLILLYVNKKIKTLQHC